jgi:hypothetical protein
MAGEEPTTPAPAPRQPIPRPPPLPYESQVLLNTTAGFLLALVVWGWVIMPFLTGGPAGVKKVLLAKFINKTPDGRWLP